jgi:hypothetical protein
MLGASARDVVRSTTQMREDFMRSVHWLSALLFAAAFAGVTFASSTDASAHKCCFSPLCQQPNPPVACIDCVDCASDNLVDEFVYDDYEDDVCLLSETLEPDLLTCPECAHLTGDAYVRCCM